MSDPMVTDWMVYRCDAHRTTQYVNANPRHGPVALCCEAAVLVAVADQHEFCGVLRGLGAA